MKKRLLASLSIFVLAGSILAGCGETQVEKVDKKSSEKTEQKAKNQIFKVGDTVKVNGLEVTITKASFTKPEQYSKAKKGNVLTLELSTKNSGDDSAFIDNTEFNLYDKDGNQLEEYYGYDDIAISGDVNKGKKLTGKLYYDVPKADSYELIYKPSFTLDSKEIKFKIDVK
ncbi:DUF4352 domain-containing protein [Heyndrickxia vini]|uniref:DUF4352 domain-containing protein n=1 Tax=Heyndrickxia vini TaxID=1476025 RepID=A0ABX7E2T7_9BACI|nr:DUF4352 domain-containing protein [Heyndrickxia vini]QQZ10029.1 DUF4352 domain-containing protein [Heyndrickxia vini]